MPREQRKRGRRHKKEVEAEPEVPAYVEDQEELQWVAQSEAGPSHQTTQEQDANYPFGILDPDVKAYFRMVDDKLKGWQTGYSEEDAGLVEGEDPNETRRMFLNAALEELNGKELQLATDPECSVILERMMYSMDDFSRRVFFDRLSGAFTQLACHRFASHVCQTLVTLSADTISRECRGILPKLPPPTGEEGELPTMTELIKSAYEEVMPSLSSVVMDPFGSHVLGALIILLCGDKLPLSISPTSGMVRSKKSAKYRAKQGPMTAVIDTPESAISGNLVPAEFPQLAINIAKELRSQMDSNSVRSLAAHKAANPLMQLILQVEAKGGLADEEGSLMDSFLAGMIGQIQQGGEEEVEESDYVQTMLRDATASHILEAILAVAPERVVGKLWDVYFLGKLAKLAVHPVANFVVATAISRLDGEQLEQVWEEMKGRWPAVLKQNRTGALRAAVARAGEVGQGDAAIEALKATFGFGDATDKKNIVPCILTCLPYTTFKEQKLEVLVKTEAPTDADGQPHHQKQPQNDLITLQGSLLLQALLRLPSPSNTLILDSLDSLTPDQRLALAHNPTSARVIDAMLDSPTVPPRAKRMWITGYIGRYHELVDDKIGSRVGDLCWAKADTFLKEKIARSLIPHETFLAASHYGRFFARKLRLTLLQRKPEDWKAVQSGSAAPAKPAASGVNKLPITAAAVPAATAPADAASAEAPKKKRKSRASEADEIDALFSAVPKQKKAKNTAIAMPGKGQGQPEIPKKAELLENVKADKTLAGVLDAIKETRTHEKAESRPRKKRKV